MQSAKKGTENPEELFIYQSIIKERCAYLSIEDSDLIDGISYMGKVVRDIQDLSIGLRMIPLRNVFTKVKFMTPRNKVPIFIGRDLGL